MHQAAIRSLGLVEDRLRKHLPGKKATYHKEKKKEGLRSQPLQNETTSRQAMKSIENGGKTQGA
jgi:hypothetical protein